MQFSTGIVLMSGYAHKLRRVIFAQISNLIKEGKITKEQANTDVGLLNRKLYKILVEELKLDRTDIVRIKGEYEILDGKIVWKYDKITIEVWKKDTEQSEKATELIRKEAEKPQEEKSEGEAEKYSARKIGTTIIGEEIYEILKNDESVGAIRVMKLDDTIVVTGALIPDKKIKVTLPAADKIETALPTIIRSAEPATPEEVKKILKEILAVAQ